ncbi:SEC-C metal-binding domain-containing protein [Oceanobacillus sp. CF4.6]|uniref:tetratricopeptide repeat protein n=1 Tax=Oceanobacillus sp. CF4.6 TaxID=3373080 RepID=UPI003EE47DB9
MSRLKRNDPCSCGSGKKYKKCCGASNVIAISPEIYNMELEQLHAEIISFALHEHGDKMEEVVTKYPPAFLVEDEEQLETYMTYVKLWAIMNVPLFDNNQTTFDLFYNRHLSKIKHTRTKNTFAEWSKAKPGVFDIRSIDEEAQKATVCNIITDDIYEIPYLEDDDFEENNIAIGIVVPYVQHHKFLFTMLEVFGDMREEIVNLTGVYTNKDGGLKKNFPPFLADVLMLGSDVLEWDNQAQEMVAELFTRNMKTKGADDEIISAAVLLWNIYCKKEHPVFKKLGSYAAAVDYFLQVNLTDDPMTQSQIAIEYGTTATTVSTNYRRLEKVLDEEMANMMEEDIDGDTVHTPVSSNMEHEMRDIHKHLEGMDFSSEDELQTYLNDLLANGGIPSTPSTSSRDLALDKLFQAAQAHGYRRTQLINEALSIYPNSPDAYILLADDAKTINEQRQLVHQAMIVGKKDLGKNYFTENIGHFWSLIETRPYMRAKETYATLMYNLSDVQEAMLHYEELLELNTNDNQGIRYRLLPIYIEQEMYTVAQSLIKFFEDDGTANFCFNNVLVHYYIKGMTSKTKSLLKVANKQNPFVRDYLLGKKPIPNRGYTHTGFGDETEAIVYAQEHIHLWSGKHKLLKEL